MCVNSHPPRSFFLTGYTPNPSLSRGLDTRSIQPTFRPMVELDIDSVVRLISRAMKFEEGGQVIFRILNGVWFFVVG